MTTLLKIWKKLSNTLASSVSIMLNCRLLFFIKSFFLAQMSINSLWRRRRRKQIKLLWICKPAVTSSTPSGRLAVKASFCSWADIFLVHVHRPSVITMTSCLPIWAHVKQIESLSWSVPGSLAWFVVLHIRSSPFSTVFWSEPNDFPSKRGAILTSICQFLVLDPHGKALRPIRLLELIGP